MSWWQRVLPPTKLERDLVWQCVLSAFATGTFLTGTAVYFTRIVGLSGAEVGLGMSIAAVVTLVLQLIAYKAVDFLLHDLSRRIEAGEMAPAIVLVAVKVAMAAINAAAVAG